MNSESPSKYTLEFYAQNKSPQGLKASISIDKIRGVTDSRSSLTKRQIQDLDKIVKKASRRSVYQQLFDGIIQKGGAGECGFYPQENTLYFVSEGDDPIDEFIGKV